MTEFLKVLGDIAVAVGIDGLIMIAIIAGAIGFFWYKINKSSNKTVRSLETGFNRMTETIAAQNDKLFEALVEQNKENSQFLKTVVMGALQDKSSSDFTTHADNLDYRLKISNVIAAKIHDLLNRYNADRAFILEFHNSKQNLSGLSFLWYDMVYEEIAKGVSLIQSGYKDQEVSTLLPIINDINNNGGYKIYYIDDLENLQKTSMALYHRLRVERQLTEAIMVGLYSSSNRLLGVLVLEYEEDSFIPVEVLDSEDIVATATSIATLLDCSAAIKESAEE